MKRLLIPAKYAPLMLLATGLICPDARGCFSFSPSSAPISGEASLLLYWDPGTCPGGTNYYLYLSSQPSFANILDVSVATVSSAAFSGLLPDSTYYVRLDTTTLMQAPYLEWTLSTLPDTTPPYDLQFPLISISQSLSAKDVGSPLSLQLSIDGSPITINAPSSALTQVLGSSQSYWTSSSTFSFAMEQLPDGPHLWTLNAQDAAGNIAVDTLPFTTTNTPAGLAATNVSTGSAMFSWTMRSPTQDAWFELRALSGTGPLIDSGLLPSPAGSYSSNTLFQNTTYFFRVRPNLSPGINFASTTFVTLANPPDLSPPSFGDVGSSSFTVSWGWNLNPTGTIYEAWVSRDQQFQGGNQTISTSGIFAEFSSLLPGATYYARVRAVNHAGVPTNFLDLGSVTLGLMPAGQTALISVLPGTATLVAPAGAFPSAYALEATENPGADPATADALSRAAGQLSAAYGDPRRGPVAGTLFGVTALDSSGREMAPQASLTLIVSFRTSGGSVSGAPAGTRPGMLSLYGLDESRGAWVRLPSVVDEEAGTVTAESRAYTVFALIGKTDTSVDDVIASPQPFEPANGSPLTFSQMPQHGTLKIYTLAGALVRTLREEDGDGRLEWDGRTDGGNASPAGVYFFVLESPTDRKLGKVMLLR